ncbi:MAG: hypothetical protein GY782_02015, partial [Gammaproteobacteria bacterium]|nr:hypothetical protein [Gammaproteobacteria bacterium]
NLILPCPITQKGTGEPCCNEHLCFSSESLANHLASRHNQQGLKSFAEKHCLSDSGYMAAALKGGPNSPSALIGGTKKQLAELIRQWITAPYTKLVVDPRKVANDNLDTCETLGPEITGIVFRREWRYGGNPKGRTHYPTMISLLTKWKNEGRTNYPDGPAYGPPTAHALAAVPRFRSLRDGKYGEDFCALLPDQREQYSRRSLKVIKVSKPVRSKLQEKRLQSAEQSSLKTKGRPTPSSSRNPVDTSFAHPLAKRPEQKGSGTCNKRSIESKDCKGAKKSRGNGAPTPIPSAVLPNPDRQMVRDSRGNQRGNQKLTALETQQKEMEWFLGGAQLGHLPLWTERVGDLSDAPVALTRFLKEASPGTRKEMDDWLDACQRVSKHLSLVQQEGLIMMGQVKHVHVYAQGLEQKVQSLEKVRVEAERKESRDHVVTNKILQ